MVYPPQTTGKSDYSFRAGLPRRKRRVALSLISGLALCLQFASRQAHASLQLQPVEHTGEHMAQVGTEILERTFPLCNVLRMNHGLLAELLEDIGCLLQATIQPKQPFVRICSARNHKCQLLRLKCDTFQLCWEEMYIIDLNDILAILIAGISQASCILRGDAAQGPITIGAFAPGKEYSGKDRGLPVYPPIRVADGGHPLAASLCLEPKSKAKKVRVRRIA